jgi:hypothetical protein
MISYEEALAIARSKKPKINGCSEYNNAYVFGYDDGNHHIGGPNSPIVIMKDTGEALNLISYAITPNKEHIRDFDIDE